MALLPNYGGMTLDTFTNTHMWCGAQLIAKQSVGLLVIDNVAGVVSLQFGNDNWSNVKATDISRIVLGAHGERDVTPFANLAELITYLLNTLYLVSID